jgi:hypothetical protein
MAARPTYWLTRFVILRLLGLVYAFAFIVAINQIIPLIGRDGLTPLAIYYDRVSESLGGSGAGFLRLPSLFWFGQSDSFLLLAAWTGFILSCVVIAGYANALMLAFLWFLYMSTQDRNGMDMAGRSSCWKPAFSPSFSALSLIYGPSRDVLRPSLSSFYSAG